MSCETCKEARPSPATYPMFAEGCLFCSARRIQYIQRAMNLPPAKKAERCRKALAQAMETGLAEQEIRAMAKLAAWVVEPVQIPKSTTRNRESGGK